MFYESFVVPCMQKSSIAHFDHIAAFEVVMPHIYSTICVPHVMVCSQVTAHTRPFVHDGNSGCCTLTSVAEFYLLAWQGTQPTVLQLFLRYSVETYKCTNASKLLIS